MAKNEIIYTRDLDHPNIIKLLDYSAQQSYISETGKESDVYFLALELASGGELFDFVYQTGRLSEKIARYYFIQLLDSLQYIHSKGISHWDIKLQNILIDSKFNLKLADFGFSSNQATNSTYKGSGEYMAPEIVLGSQYFGPAVDLFAAGVLLFYSSQHKIWSLKSTKKFKSFTHIKNVTLIDINLFKLNLTLLHVVWN